MGHTASCCLFEATTTAVDSLQSPPAISHRVSELAFLPQLVRAPLHWSSTHRCFCPSQRPAIGGDGASDETPEESPCRGTPTSGDPPRRPHQQASGGHSGADPVVPAGAGGRADVRPRADLAPRLEVHQTPAHHHE